MGKQQPTAGSSWSRLRLPRPPRVLLMARDHRQPARFSVRFDPHKEATFERARGEEASRNGADTPVAEQVADRAYPRAYVDDHLALKSRDAFKSKPSTLTASAFSTTSAFNAAQASQPRRLADARPGDAERRG